MSFHEEDNNTKKQSNANDDTLSHSNSNPISRTPIVESAKSSNSSKDLKCDGVINKNEAQDLPHSQKPNFNHLSPQMSNASDWRNFENLPTKINITTPTKLENEIPCYELNSDQLENPIAFIDSLKKVSEKYGAIKVKLPQTEQKLFKKYSPIDFNQFQFRSNKLLNNPKHDELFLRLNFHKKLVEFSQSERHLEIQTRIKKEHQLKTMSLRSDFEKNSVDLYTLFNLVTIKGGFKSVDDRNLWTLLCIELGYKRWEINDVSELLKSVYFKVLYPYEVYLRDGIDETNSISDRKRNIQPNDSNKRAKSERSQAPLIIGSAKEFKRSAKIKKSKGILLNSPHLIDITYPHVSTKNTNSDRRVIQSPYTQMSPQTKLEKAISNISSHQDDSRLCETNSPIYTLKEFMNKDLHFQQYVLQQNEDSFNSNNINLDKLEDLFWKYVKNESSAESFTDCLINAMGRDISSSISGSGFPSLGDDLVIDKQATKSSNTGVNPTPSRDRDDFLKMALHPWNLHNITHLPNSILGSLNEHDVNNQESNETRTNIGMIFSTENWTCEDHFTQLINYHHFGACKKWYFIPTSEFEKFENLIIEINQNTVRSNINNQQGTDISKILELLQSNPGINHEELRQSLQYTINTKQDIRSRFKDEQLAKLLKSNLFQYNQEFMIIPELLTKHGIRFTSVIQHPGEFIIKSPKTYSSMLSFGFNFSEEVNIATKHWLDYSIESEKWLTKQCLIPNFSIFKIIINLAITYDTGGHIYYDSEIFHRISNIYDTLYTNEIDLRNQIRKLKVKEVIIDENSDFLSDDQFENAFPTRILVSNTKSKKSIILSMRAFLKYKDNEALQKSKIEMQMVYSDERLKTLHKILSSYTIDFRSWIESYKEFLRSKAIVPLKSYKVMLNEGEKIHTAIFPRSVRFDHQERDEELTNFNNYIGNLQKFVSESSQFVESCQTILAMKHQQRIRNGTDTAKLEKCPSFDDLMELVSKIPKLNFTSPEIDQILELKLEIENFDKACRILLSKSNKSQADFENMINLGESFGLEIPTLTFMTRVKRRLEWMQTYDLIEKGVDPFVDRKEVFTISDLLELYNRGFDLLSSGDSRIMEQLENILSTSQEFDHQVSTFLNYNHVTDLNLEQLSKFVQQFNEEKLFISLKNYTELSDLHDNLKLIKQTHDFNQSSYNEMKQLYTSIMDSGLKFDPKAMVQSLSETENWIDNIWIESFQQIKIVTTFDENFKNDIKSTINLQLIKKLNQLLLKCKYSFNDDDKYTEGSSYLTRNGKNDNAKYYCICRENEFGTMVACDRCLEWYHVQCVNAREDDLNYVCPICSITTIDEKLLEGRIQYTKLKEIYDIGLKLHAVPSVELDIIEEIIEIADKFCDRIQANINNMSINSDVQYNLDYSKYILRKIYGSGIYFGELVFRLLDLIRKIEEDLIEQHLRPKEIIYEIQYESETKPPLIKEVKESENGFKILSDVSKMVYFNGDVTNTNDSDNDVDVPSITDDKGVPEDLNQEQKVIVLPESKTSKATFSSNSEPRVSDIKLNGDGYPSLETDDPANSNVSSDGNVQPSVSTSNLEAYASQNSDDFKPEKNTDINHNQGMNFELRTNQPGFEPKEELLSANASTSISIEPNGHKSSQVSNQRSINRKIKVDSKAHEHNDNLTTQSINKSLSNKLTEPNDSTVNESFIMKEIDKLNDIDVSREIRQISDYNAPIRESTPEVQNTTQILPSMVSLTSTTPYQKNDV